MLGLFGPKYEGTVIFIPVGSHLPYIVLLTGGLEIS
jgi:hypothetical protein